ncbi:MAG: hydroxyacid dehydrogenase [Thermoanaerobacterium sp.]|nr:hydroxyacid dehydrogenase [Thermoanaerobacterium sp.]
MSKLRALVVPSRTQFEMVSNPATRQLIDTFFDTDYNNKGREMTQTELADVIAKYDVLLTTWGSPVIDNNALSRAGRLKYVGHAAGSVKNRIPFEVFEKGIRVFSAASRIADSVAEYCLASILACLRYLPQQNAAMKAGKWKVDVYNGHELRKKKVGLVSLSSTARALIRLLKPFECEILVYDPYMTDEKAQMFEVKPASLEEVFSCPIVSLHTPDLPTTRGMITRELIKMLPDEAVFVNSSRGRVIDEQALIEELSTGRFIAALDVYTVEPLPQDSPLRKMDNVLITPHIAGHTIECHEELMGCVVRDIIAAINNEPTKYEIDPRQWEIIA